ncbi:30S ribosomal protein S17e [Candidatus Woesearchaeota archaeon]|nr:30S ribosomal protein S17e [Candidatus Woesearchaeota archaeon]
MGRIKTTLQKRLARKIVAQKGEGLGTEFDGNKKAISIACDFPSKKLRNVVAGYVTRLMRRAKQ